MKTKIVDGFMYCELKSDRRRAPEQVAEFEKALQLAVPHLLREYDRAADIWIVAEAYADQVEAMRERHMFVETGGLFAERVIEQGTPADSMDCLITVDRSLIK